MTDAKLLAVLKAADTLDDAILAVACAGEAVAQNSGIGITSARHIRVLVDAVVGWKQAAKSLDIARRDAGLTANDMKLLASALAIKGLLRAMEAHRG